MSNNRMSIVSYDNRRTTSRQTFFCSRCGRGIDPGTRYCARCGSAVSSASRHASYAQYPSVYDSRDYYSISQGNYRDTPDSAWQSAGSFYSTGSGRLSVDPRTALNYVTRRMRSSGTIWILIGIYQLLVGFVTLIFGYGIFAIGVGIWNIAYGSRQKKTAAEYAVNPIGIISAFENGRTMSIVFIFLNLFLGAGFGILGSIYDLVTSSYVLSHRDAFERLEKTA